MSAPRFSAWLVAWVVCVHAFAPLPGQDRVRALIVTGANNHDWTHTSNELRVMLEESGLFDVTVTTDPSVALADADVVGRTDVFVLDYNGPRWGEPAESRFLQAVRTGTGVAVIHAADNAFPGWTEYEKLVGDLWRKGTGHGRFHAFDVDVDDSNHPITAGLAPLRDHPDELYHRLVHTPGVRTRVLMSAFSDPKTGGTGRREPMLLVGSYGKGRMFHTPLGHVWRGVAITQRSLADPGLRALIVRGVEWAATGACTHDGHPPRAGDPRPIEPFVVRCTFGDAAPRIVVAALSRWMWAAWDADRCALVRVWAGGLDAVPEAQDALLRRPRGLPYETFAGKGLEVLRAGDPVTSELSWEGLRLIPQGAESARPARVEFSYRVTFDDVAGESVRVTVRESPEHPLGHAPDLERRFRVEGLPEGYALRLDLGEPRRKATIGVVPRSARRGARSVVLGEGETVVTCRWRLAGAPESPPPGRSKEESSTDGGDGREQARSLTPAQRAVGWTSLLAGRDVSAWRGFRRESFPEVGWQIDRGALAHREKGRAFPLLTRETHAAFEFAVRWRTAPDAAGGIGYRISEEDGAVERTGPTFVLRVGAAPDPKDAAGAVAGVLAPEVIVAPAADRWHEARLVSRPGRVEHWLDGVRVLAYDPGGAAFREAVAASSHAGVPGWGTATTTPVALSARGAVSYDSARILPLGVARKHPVTESERSR